MELITSLLVGAVGGNIGGTLVKKISLGLIGNSLAGIIGGGMGSQILQSALAKPTQNGFFCSILGGIVGGMLVMALIGIIKKSWSEEHA